MDRTLVICKPDAVERGLVGEILGRFERRTLRAVALELRTLDADLLGRHYEEHVGKSFYDDLVAFMSRGPVVTMVIEGPEDTFRVVRSMMGATNPRDAAPGTIRGDLGISHTENLVHGSDSPESAAREIGIFFPHLG
jgi:nucleoside-diphosphate kinase